MPQNIFSTYRQGENRVTASILAVLRSLALHRIERILGALIEQSEFQLVRFQNQPAAHYKGVPDAEIVASCRLVIETKTRSGSVRAGQVRRHLRRLKGSREAQKLLLVLTPDSAAPQAVERLKDDRVAWSSFAALDQAIDHVLSDPEEVVSEREAFLLKELQAMLKAEGLVVGEKDTVVVPARHAWPQYQRAHAYICQAGRTFQSVKYVAFYHHNRIEPVVPAVLEVHDPVMLKRGLHKGRLAQVVARQLTEYPQHAREQRKIFVLSPPDDPRTLRLPQPVENDQRSAAGGVTAFTQNQRYVKSADLRRAQRTSQLVGA